MSEDVKNLTYDLHPSDPAPVPGEYLVSIGKKGVGTVYFIKAVRVIRPRQELRHRIRYRLTVQPQPELKLYTEYVLRYHGADVWVRGQPAHPCFWYPRNAKK